jgi:ADP-heptose:LPS heptosyltransferase
MTSFRYRRAVLDSRGKSAAGELPPGTLPPRPAMRGRYLIRSAGSATFIRGIDALLGLLPRRSGDLQPPFHRILLANWAHLGDVLLTLPAIGALREVCPGAHIGMIAGSWAEMAVRESRLVDQVHVIDHWFLNRNKSRRFVRYRETRGQALAEIRAANYQLAIDFYPFFAPAHPLFYRCHIPCRVGFNSGGFGPLLTRAVRWLDADRPICDYMQDLVSVVLPHVRIGESAWRHPLPERAATEVIRGRYAVVHPGAGSPAKEWGERNWRALVRSLRTLGDRVVITGAGAREEALGARLAAGDESVVNLVGKTDWPGLLATIAGAEALVCPDSSAAHIGALFNIPTVAIFTGTNNPAQWAPRNPYARILVKPIPCAPCNRPGCLAMACIRGVTVEEVVAALQECRLRRAGERAAS